jgi:hypothetical protein
MPTAPLPEAVALRVVLDEDIVPNLFRSYIKRAYKGECSKLLWAKVARQLRDVWDNFSGDKLDTRLWFTGDSHTIPIGLSLPGNYVMTAK